MENAIYLFTWVCEHSFVVAYEEMTISEEQVFKTTNTFKLHLSQIEAAPLWLDVNSFPSMQNKPIKTDKGIRQCNEIGTASIQQHN